MNKLDFLRRLDKELSVLDREERKEILGFYEERFYSGTIYENKTEAEVIAELERPEVIARNVLEEYGVSPKFVKVKEERYSNINPVKAVFLISFDVLIASSVLPSLYAAAVSILISSFTWVTTIGLMIGERTAVDEYAFAFITGAFILLFLFGLVVLETALWFTRTLIKWHLNVFKVKNREKTFKKLSHLSLDSWFKKHRRAKRFKNFATVVAIVAVVISGFWMINHRDWVQAEYGRGEIVSDVITEDFETEINDMEMWSIETNLENISVEVVLVSGDDVVIKHTYYEEDEFTYEFDYEHNIITIANDTDDLDIQFLFNPTDLFSYFSEEVEVRIEIPLDLVLDEMVLTTSNASVDVVNVDSDILDIHTSNANVNVTNAIFTGDVSIQTSNGKIDFSNIEVSEDVSLDTSNGKIDVNNIEVNGTGYLTAETSNSGVYISNVNFNTYTVETSNGTVRVQDLNTALSGGATLTIVTSNGAIKLEDVYANNIDASTSNGNIDFDNSDTSYHPSDLELSTSSYNDVESNVTED